MARHPSRDPSYFPTGTPIVRTAGGNLVVHEGDWIITRTNGEKYICTDSVFNALWEPYAASPIVTIQ